MPVPTLQYLQLQALQRNDDLFTAFGVPSWHSGIEKTRPAEKKP